MNVKDVLFVGGGGHRGSVKIRCIDVARALGCDYVVAPFRISALSSRYRAFICIKPELGIDELRNLGRRGVVVWDIVESPPPPESGISHFLVSSTAAQSVFSPRGEVTLIPHHHCNFSGRPNTTFDRQAAWVGNLQWKPRFDGIPVRAFDARAAVRPRLVRFYRKCGIVLNLRKSSPEAAWHIRINSGIKLINCVGFGIPSVSAREPAYLEFGEGCTLFAKKGEWRQHLQTLQADVALYDRLKRNCIIRAHDFHIQQIAKQYERFIGRL